MTLVAEFQIQYQHFLDPSGRLSQDLPSVFESPEAIIPLYKHMVLNRVFDTKAIALQRTGQMGTYPSSEGQEAIGAGIAYPMRKEDVFVPSYREHGAMLMRGVTMTDILLYWGGDERGSDYQGPKQDLPVSVPIATHATHAAGVAQAFKYRNEKRVAVCACGDGATSKGDFYEGLNFAGVWDLPVVFVVSNNQWAISVPLELQTKTQTLAQKAIGAGIEGLQVDGNDLIAMTDAMSTALDKARNGGGPTLIEAMTYRMGDHTTADDASRYRTKEDVQRAKDKDPIQRIKAYLVNENLWSDADDVALKAKCSEQVEAAVKAYLDTPAPSAASIFDYMYAEMPASLKQQKDAHLQGRIL